MKTAHTIIALASVALVAGLTGCSESAATKPDADSHGAVEAERSPLDEYLGAAYDSGLSPKEQEAKAKELDARVNELVASCMKEEGFEFFIVDDRPAQTTDVEVDWRPDDRDWVEKYGYGLQGYPGSDAGESVVAAPNPNFEYRDSLPESAQVAYDLAYSGPDNPVDANGEPILEYDWTQEGCNGRANHEVFDSEELDPYADLLARIDEVQRPREDSPEMIALDGEWSACMAEAGESGFANHFEASASLSGDDKLETGEPAEDEPSDDGAEEQDPAELKAQLEREIELALIDLDCREKTEYAKKSLEIQYAAERKFIEDNKAELDEYKLAAEQADG